MAAFCKLYCRIAVGEEMKGVTKFSDHINEYI